MKLILMGYMGCGKSTVGQQLAKDLSCDFLDLDQFISQNEKLSISGIFERHGAIYFRIKESEYLDQVLALIGDHVIALGGGTPCYGNNLQRIKNATDTYAIYLQGSVPFLSKRLFNERFTRPLIRDLDSIQEMDEFIGKHLFERNQFYSKADLTIKIEDKSVKEISSEILNHYSK